jgi:hypothetical protein
MLQAFVELLASGQLADAFTFVANVITWEGK